MAQTAIPVSTKHTSLSSLETVAPPVATESLSISTLASVALPVATSHPSLSLPVPAPLTMAAENRTRLSFVLGSGSQNPAAAVRVRVIIGLRRVQGATLFLYTFCELRGFGCLSSNDLQLCSRPTHSPAVGRDSHCHAALPMAVQLFHHRERSTCGHVTLPKATRSSTVIYV